MAFIDYNINNFCTRCEIEFSKEKGSKCPKCGYQARTLPRNPKVFKEKQNSEIWASSDRLQSE